MRTFIRHWYFLLMLAGAAMPAGVRAQNAWINEVHYDNSGTDTLEMIEVAVENPGFYSLSQFSVVLYNGNGGAVYGTRTLATYTAGSTYGNYTLYYFMYPKDGVQNGEPDGIALAYDGSLIPGQFLSYEGSFTGVGGVAAGITSIDIGVEETGNTPVGHSLQLSGTGAAYSGFIWQPPAAYTPGTLNNGQVIQSPGIGNPSDFNALTYSQTQINLGWNLNSSGNDVLVAWNDSNNFGTPAGSYSEDDPIAGGGTVLYKGPGTYYFHTGLATATQYYYKAWSVTSSNSYSAGVTDSAVTQFTEPTNHPNGLVAASNGPTRITVSWTDSDAPSYLVKGSNTGYGGIVAPLDGIPEADAKLVENVPASVQQHQFSGLTPNTQYFFKIFPYHGSGTGTNYKTDGNVPQTYAFTDSLRIGLLISEVADPADSSLAKFVEIHNAGTTNVNLSDIPVFLNRQTNGNPSLWSFLQLNGTLAPGEEFVVAHASNSTDTVKFASAFGFQANAYSDLVTGNGNDGYFLSIDGNYSTGYIFDSFGAKNQNGTGQAWEYTDKKAVRKRNIASPNASWTASEWFILADQANAADMTPGFHKGDVIWQGYSSSIWNEKGPNWSSPYGYIPDAGCNVTIPDATTDPVVNRPGAINAIQLQSGSVLSISPTGSLFILGP